MDFPTTNVNPPVINSLWSPETALGWINGTTTTTSTAWPSNNRGYFVPFTLSVPFLVRKMWWSNGGTASGNVDVGVYTGGAVPVLLASAGSTAQSGTSVLQSVDTTDIWLAPGSYYMALAFSSTAGTTRAIAPGASRAKTGGVMQADSMIPLAAPTLATLATSFIPLFGITSRTVI